MSEIYSVIKGTGSYIPCINIPNKEFLDNKFFDAEGDKIQNPQEELIEKFKAITGINERKYLHDDYVNSDLAFLAAERALLSSGIDKESLDYIIVAHNFGDMKAGNLRTDMMPSLAARVKKKLGIENPWTVAYDLIFGCPGWLQAMIQADYFIKSGDAKRIMVIGTDVLSRASDPHDRDSMIYSDGSGATILEGVESDDPVGIISKSSRSDAINHSRLMWMGHSNNPDYTENEIFIKMNGRKVYEYAISTVPSLVKGVIDRAGLHLTDIKKVLIHQANEKLDQGILKGLFRLYNAGRPPEDLMPMTISFLGNNSVATVPILSDLLNKKKLNGHSVDSGDHIVYASVGAGMNINAFVYKMP